MNPDKRSYYDKKKEADERCKKRKRKRSYSVQPKPQPQPDTMQQQHKLKKPNPKRAKVVPYSQSIETKPGYDSSYNPTQPDTMKKQQDTMQQQQDIPHNNTSQWRQSTMNLQNELNNLSLQQYSRAPSPSMDETYISELNSQIQKALKKYP